MNNSLHNTDPLSNLKPIQYPSHGVDYWPLAPVWWLIITCLAVFILSFTYWYLLKRKQRRYQAAWHSIEEIFDKEYQKATGTGDARIAVREYLQSINALLKKIVRQYRPGDRIVTESGQNWIRFLSEQEKNNTASLSYIFSEKIYDKTYAIDRSLEEIHQWAKAWARHFWELHNKPPGVFFRSKSDD